MNEENKKKKFDFGEFFKYLKFVFKYAKKSRKYLYLFGFLCILLTGISIVVPVLSAQQLVKLTSSLWKELFISIGGIFVLEISRNIIRYFINYAYCKFSFDVRRNIQLELCKETLKISTNDLYKNSSGVFIDRINNDAASVTDIFVILIDYLTTIIGDIGVFISVFFISKIMFLIYLVFIIILYKMHKRAANINYENEKIMKKKNEKVYGFTSELVRGAKDIKILDAEKSFIKHTDELLKNTNKQRYITNRTRAKLRLEIGNIKDILDLTCNVVTALLLMFGKLELSAVLIIINYQNKIMSISGCMETLFEKVKQFDLAASRVYGILEGDEFSKENFGSIKSGKLSGTIEFKNINFGYDNKLILKNMNFTIPANKTVAFVGKSGAGKSTIFNLISALYKPDSGDIYLDDYNINDLDKDSIRGNLSIISQDPYIYNLSIRDNLKIIKKDATEEDIIRACKMACLHDFIINLDNGYDTLVGEGGVTLSGGQKQRLAIARAFLLDTKIILLDEATSALDNETQSNIQKAIKNMQGDYTVLIIAHRLSTVAHADTIYVVENGKIIDSGNQEELLKNSRTFKKLYENELEGD